MEFYVIVNPYAGNGRGSLYLERITSIANALQGKVLVSLHPSHSIRLAKSIAQRGRVIFAAGGDDTVREVLQGIYASRATLGIIPLGTFNNLAASLNLPDDPIKCLLLSLKGKVHLLDVGKIETGPFFVESLGIGLDAFAWSKAPHNEPRGLGRWLIGTKIGLQSLFTFKPQNYYIYTNDRFLHFKNVWQINIANSPYYCSRIKIAPHARLNDGLLDVCIIQGLKKRQILSLAPLLYVGQHLQDPHVHYLQTPKVAVIAENSQPYPVRVDGMLLSQLPLKALALRQTVKVLLPCQ